MSKKELDQLIESEWETIRTLVKKIVKNPDLEDEVLQESLLRALTSKSALKDKSKLTSWFISIIKHTLMDIYRQSSKDKKLSTALKTEPQINKKEEDSLCSCIGKMIKSLDQKDATLLTKLDLQNQSTTDTAKFLNISLNTLKVRRHRARKKLKEALIRTCKPKDGQPCIECEC